MEIRFIVFAGVYFIFVTSWIVVFVSQGSNGTFQLYLEEDNGVFEVTPSIGVNEVSFMIRVKNADYLDYERVKVMKFKVR